MSEIITQVVETKEANKEQGLKQYFIVRERER
jgi:hypothetical protein